MEVVRGVVDVVSNGEPARFGPVVFANLARGEFRRRVIEYGGQGVDEPASLLWLSPLRIDPISAEHTAFLVVTIAVAFVLLAIRVRHNRGGPRR